MFEGVELEVEEFRVSAGLTSRFACLTEGVSVDSLVTKYMKMLDVYPYDNRPTIKWRNNLAPRWLGRCIWKARFPEHSTIELQKSIQGHDKTLERVVAHEMVHHANFVDPPRDMFNRPIRERGHGPDFFRLAGLINAKMGHDFVTPESDESYEKTPNTKEFFVLVQPVGSLLGWAWAARLSSQGIDRVKDSQTRGGKLIKTKDDDWTAGVKIKKYGGFSTFKDQNSEKAGRLKKLYDQPGVSV